MATHVIKQSEHQSETISFQHELMHNLLGYGLAHPHIVRIVVKIYHDALGVSKTVVDPEEYISGQRWCCLSDILLLREGNKQKISTWALWRAEMGHKIYSQQMATAYQTRQMTATILKTKVGQQNLYPFCIPNCARSLKRTPSTTLSFPTHKSTLVRASSSLGRVPVSWL